MGADASLGAAHEVTCPHCRRTFSATLIAGGSERYRGFKCPHCKLFVPESRAEEDTDTPLTRDSDG
jgi:hypothetical protein